MELHQLRCFLAIIKEGGFNKATGRLQMTQPALSYQIRQLEKELGATLFHRRPGGVSPTEAGRVLSIHAESVMETVRRAHRAIEELSEGMVGEVRIGTVPSIGIHVFPQVLATMREKFPSIKPSVLYRHSNVIVEALVSNRIDLALMVNPQADKRFKRETVIEERLFLVCGKRHPLFGEQSISAAELKKQQFISLPSDSSTGQLIRDHLAKLGVSVDPVVSTNNIETVKKMVEMGLGIAYLPELLISPEIASEANPQGTLGLLRVGPMLARKIAMVTWKHMDMSRAIRTFAEAFVDEVKAQAKLYRITSVDGSTELADDDAADKPNDDLESDQVQEF